MTAMSKTNKVTVILDCEGNRKTLEVYPEESLLESLSRKDIYVKSSCGGVASCGDCVIKVLSGASNLSSPGFDETALLGNVFHITGERLSCQAKVSGGVTIDVVHHDRGRDQEELRKRTSHNPLRRNHKIRKSGEVKELKGEQIKQQEQEEERTWERHWEKDTSKTPSHKQGGHRRPRPFRTDHLEEEEDKDKKD